MCAFQGIYILSAIDDIQVLLDDHIIKAQTMLGSPFIVPFEEEARTWSEKLTSMQDIIDAWLKVSYEVTHALSVLPYSSLFCLPLVPSHVAVLGADLQQ